MRLLDARRREINHTGTGEPIRHAALRTDPGGFPQRKLSEVPLVGVEEMRELQRQALEEFHIDILQITENAARATATLVLAMFGGKAQGQRVLVLAGMGNNGAAGLAAVRQLTNLGFNVEPILGGVEEQLMPTARRQAEILRASGIHEFHDHDATEDSLRDHLLHADLIIDALVGYGFSGTPSGAGAAAAELAINSGRPILSLDVPSGVDASSGQLNPLSINASTTLCLDLPKKGLLEAVCRDAVGELYLADIGIPRVLHERRGLHMNGLFSEGPLVRIRR